MLSPGEIHICICAQQSAGCLTSFSFSDWFSDLKNTDSPLFLCMINYKNVMHKWNLFVWDKGQWFSAQETAKCHQTLKWGTDV